MWSRAENLAYYQMLKERFKAQIKRPQAGRETNAGASPHSL